MNPLIYWIFLGLGIIAALVFLFLRVTRGGFPGLFSKAVASLFFVATGFAGALANPANSGFATLMLLGLVLSVIGDIWLDLKWIYPKDDNTFLKAGIVSFFFGQIAFCCAQFIFFDGWTLPRVLLPLGFAVGCTAAMFVLEKPMKFNFGKNKPILLIYSLTVTMNGWSALAVARYDGYEMIHWILFAIAGALFMISDMELLKMYFGNGNNKVRIIINHTAYYAAQLLLASTIMFVK